MSTVVGQGSVEKNKVSGREAGKKQNSRRNE